MRKVQFLIEFGFSQNFRIKKSSVRFKVLRVDGNCIRTTLLEMVIEEIQVRAGESEPVLGARGAVPLPVSPKIWQCHTNLGRSVTLVFFDLSPTIRGSLS